MIRKRRTAHRPWGIVYFIILNFKAKMRYIVVNSNDKIISRII